MGLKSTNLQRSAAHREDKAAVLENNANDAGAGGSRRQEKPQRKPRPRSEQPPAARTPAPVADEVATLYVEHRKLLLFIAYRKFRVPEADAENLIQEVFLSYLQTMTPIDNVRSWLVAATCNASRHYWRAQGRLEALPDDYFEQIDPASLGLADLVAMKMTVQQALQYLQPRCFETLWMHYFEGRSAGDIARELETTARYAEKLIHNCLGHVRKVYFTINKLGEK